MQRKVRAIAFYLPQFHPIPENDEWWGEGFTEWTNVKNAVPLFESHEQPVKPGVLGYYDLRDPLVRQQQADLASAHGIEGFCYWHYWFGNGKRILEKVFEEVLATGKPDFPFCLAWANESWTGVWHGLQNKILVEQQYPGVSDYQQHFDWLVNPFNDKRYIRVDNKPLFVVYRPQDIPNLPQFVDTFRSQAMRNGFEGIYLVANNAPDDWNPELNGFDAIAPTRLHTIRMGIKQRIADKVKSMLKVEDGPFRKTYQDVLELMKPVASASYKRLPCIIPNWDNTPRSGKRGWVLENSSPTLFGHVLSSAIEQVMQYPYEERLVFLKSWNEWAEGNYLEPDEKWGTAYLEVIKKQVEEG